MGEGGFGFVFGFFQGLGVFGFIIERGEGEPKYTYAYAKSDSG